MSAGGRESGGDPTPVPAPTAGLLTPRGETTIAPVVVEKIASKAAREVDGVGGVVRTGLGRLLPWVAQDAPAQVDADVERQTVSVDLTVNVRYPQPVGKVAGQVREHVVHRLTTLTGLAVTDVNITVDELVLERPSDRRRVE